MVSGLWPFCSSSHFISIIRACWIMGIIHLSWLFFGRKHRGNPLFCPLRFLALSSLYSGTSFRKRLAAAQNILYTSHSPNISWIFLFTFYTGNVYQAVFHPTSQLGTVSPFSHIHYGILQLFWLNQRPILDASSRVSILSDLTTDRFGHLRTDPPGAP